MKVNRGLLCSISGKNYEKEVYNIVKRCNINGIIFNNQKEEELAGSSCKNDIVCNYLDKEIGIEIKKYNAPDWMQCSIKYNDIDGIWKASNGKIPYKCRLLFNELIKDYTLYDGELPPFIKKTITHKEWKTIKKETNKWKDTYINIPSDTIRKLYSLKGCKYIQLSDGYGLYHLGEDTCNFNVPIFEIKQVLRIRTKVHSANDKDGFCKLSVTASCQPINIRELEPSPYSIDNIDKLPDNLIYV